MLKLIGFLIWWGSFFGGVATSVLGFMRVSDMSDGSPLPLLIIGGILFLISGMGRRIFHISENAINKSGMAGAILSRINCKRTYASIFYYAILLATVYSVVYVSLGGGHILYLGLTILGAGAVAGVNDWMKHTCSRCGSGLVHDYEDYDDTEHVTVSSNSVSSYRYSTGYYHCPRCGKKSTIRVKHNTGTTHFH